MSGLSGPQQVRVSWECRASAVQRSTCAAPVRVLVSCQCSTSAVPGCVQIRPRGAHLRAKFRRAPRSGLGAAPGCAAERRCRRPHRRRLPQEVSSYLGFRLNGAQCPSNQLEYHLPFQAGQDTPKLPTVVVLQISSACPTRGLAAIGPKLSRHVYVPALALKGG